MILEKYSFGVGDRFGCQGKAQLQAMIAAKQLGVDIVPVWNKSYREHSITHTKPQSVRFEADAAVKALQWKGSYHVDADHINMSNVDLFIDSCDFFTLDVADYIGKSADSAESEAFTEKYEKYAAALKIDGINGPLRVTREQIKAIATKFLLAIQEAGKLYRHIESKKGKGHFITEISMDETKFAQSPVEMLFILAAIADEGIPAQTIAPKFTGRFNKGVDYVGDVAQFEREFRDDLAIIAFAVNEFGLPENLKLSIHSGSDKFSIYGAINRAMREFDAGIHVKTAGTTWLEELIGLTEADGEGLEIAKEVYVQSLNKYDELCAPYATVIDIDKSKLPTAEMINEWSGTHYAQSLRHDQACMKFNPHLRQLLHVGYKIAAQMGERYLCALKNDETIVSKNVMENISERHIKRIFF